MATNEYLVWARSKEPKKEHVSFRNFVIKFCFTDKESAHEAYLSLIDSQHIRKRRRIKLHNAYKLFKDRSEAGFWESRALKTADHMLLVTSATVAKKSGAMIQKAGLREANSGLKRYSSELSDVETLEVIDDSDENESEPDEEVSCLVRDKLTAREGVEEGLDREREESVNTITTTRIPAVDMSNQEADSLYEDPELDNQLLPESVRKSGKRSYTQLSSRIKNKKPKFAPPSGPKSAPLDPYTDPAMVSRIKRYNNLDPAGFWVLSTNRAVETVLFEHSLTGDATYKMRSYTIDFDCKLTQELFTVQEWAEMKHLNQFELPKLLPSTETYIKDIYKAIMKGKHAASVPVPEENRFSCDMVLISLLKWSHLYKANPSPFGNERLSEAYWAREAWPLLKDLLSDVNGITMVDGEKHGHESTKRNGQNRRLDQEGQNPRKPGGNKLDLAARDLVNQRDWLVGEAKKEWDELGTNFLREVGVKLFKQLHLVAEHRLQENGTMAFKDKSRFFAFFSGGCGFKAIELRPTKKSCNIRLFHAHQSFVLPSTEGDWKKQLQGLIHLLRIKKSIVDTIQLYDEHHRSDNENSDDDNRDWLYDTKERLVQDTLLASSPLGPDGDD